MTDRTIMTPLGLPMWPSLWALAAAGLVVTAAATGNAHVGLVAVLPSLCALVFWLGRRPKFAARATGEGLEFTNPPATVYFDDIEEVLAPDRPRHDEAHSESASFTIRVYHRRGFFTIPAGLNVPSEEVYRLLRSRAGGAAAAVPVNAELRDYLARQEDVFGADKVWAYVARDRLSPLTSGHIGRLFGLATLAAGIVWVVVGAATSANFGKKAADAWLGVGITATILGLFLFFLFWLAGRTQRARVKNWQKSSLIVSPEGLALIQGELRGELHWEEVKDVKFRSKPASFALTPAGAVGGIVISVEGATILVADIYHRPLKEIHQRIMDYWD